MGFFDFIGKAVGAVKNLVGKQSSLVQNLESLAGMVAHAIPGVGPIVDVAVPALQAIFSDGFESISALQGSAATSALQERLKQPANIINLDRKDEDIGTVLTNCQKIQDTLSIKIEDVAKTPGKNVAELQSLIRHEKFIDLRTEVVSAVKFMDIKQVVLKNITASSGPSAFQQIFPAGSDPAFTQRRQGLSDTIDHIKADLDDTAFVPSQDMLELYLFSIHWLMFYDKAYGASLLSMWVIVCRGMLAKSQDTWGQYTTYLETLASLQLDIHILRRDAKEAFDTLRELCKRLTEKREEAVSQIRVNNLILISDTWQTLGIGWKTQKQVAEAVKVTNFDVACLPEISPVEKRLAELNLILYRDLVAQTLQVCLQPCIAVIESLEDSMRNWNARLPVSPMSLEKEKKHAMPEKPKEDENCAADAKSKLWERSVAYAVTYVNAYGESPESQWSDTVEIPQKCTAVKIKLEKIQFEGDFTAELKLVKKDGKMVPRNRGIRRRVYVQYTDDNQKTVMDRIGETNEADEWFTHNILDTKKKDHIGKTREVDEGVTRDIRDAKKKGRIDEAIEADKGSTSNILDVKRNRVSGGGGKQHELKSK